MTYPASTTVLLLSCPDRTGLVSRIAHFIYERGGNILDLDEHVDPEEKIFSIRVAWDMRTFSIPVSDLRNAFLPLARGRKTIIF
jgi:formyltetrahydrofolate deformylase